MAAKRKGPRAEQVSASVGMEGSGRKGAVLLVHRFYHPDVTPYACMLRSIGKQLAASGHQVTVFTTQPSYNNVYKGAVLPKVTNEDGVTVRRLSLRGGGTSIGRLVSGFVFGITLIAHAIRHRNGYDVISVSTVPPVFMGLTGLIAAKLSSAKLIYHCMDLYPEIAVACGLSKNRLLISIAKFCDSLTVRRADSVVVLSCDMVETLEHRGLPTGNVSIVRNFVFEDVPPRGSVSGICDASEGPRFSILFAGNLGRFQGLQSLLSGFLDAVQTAPNWPRLELTFMGAGVAADELRKVASASPFADRVRFVNHQPVRDAMLAMQQTALAVVSLSPGIINSAYPSKTMMYLAMGCRLLVIVEPKSELAELVSGRDLGSVVPPCDQEELTDAIRAEASRGRSDTDRQRAQSVAAELFGLETTLEQWTALYEQLLDRVAC